MALYDGTNLEEINLGTVINDGTGDDLHEAFRKVKGNLEFLYSNSNVPVTGANLGSGAPVFSAKNGGNLEFRSIVAGSNMAVTYNGTSITVSTTGTITANLTGNVTGNLTGNVTGNVVGRIRTGGLEALNPFVDVSDLNRTINTFDYGSIVVTFTNPIRYLMHEVGTDMGSITTPNPIGIDAGTI